MKEEKLLFTLLLLADIGRYRSFTNRLPFFQSGVNPGRRDTSLVANEFRFFLPPLLSSLPYLER